MPALLSRLPILAAFALLPASARANDVYVGLGTTGVLAGIEHHYNDAFGARIDYSGISVSRDTSDSSATYHGTAHLSALGLYADYHPWGNGFRLSGGVLLGDTHVDAVGVASANGTFTLNGVPVSAAGESLTARIKFPSARPYLGFGWGHIPKDTGLMTEVEFGAAFGRPDVSLTATPRLAALALQAGTSVEAEQARLQDKVNSLRVYPVVRLALGWGW